MAVMDSHKNSTNNNNNNNNINTGSRIQEFNHQCGRLAKQ